jgi:hypothetical protein
MENSTLNKVLSKEQIKDSGLSLYSNGLPKGFGIGLTEVDEYIRWETGRLSVITGVPSFGKSEFLDFMNVRLNRLHGWKTLYFSPENFPVCYHLQKLVSKISGKPFEKTKLSEKELFDALNYISDNFFFLNYETVRTLDDILECMEQLIHQEGVKILVIDPYNRLEHNRPARLTETEYISSILDGLSNFAKRFDVLIHLVAHPRKMNKKDGVFDVPNYYDINGSANFANKADYCLTVHRNKSTDSTEIHIEKVKFKNLGCQGVAYLKYDIPTGNYYEGDRKLPFPDIPLPQQEPEKSKGKQPVEQIQTCLNRNVLNVPVSYYATITSKEGQEINLYNFLKNKNNDIDLDTMRQQPDFKELKKSLPAVTISGVFGDSRKTETLQSHSGLICIDIDRKDQTRDMDAIFNELKQVNNIAYLGRSCSGEGLFSIVPIKDPHKHLAHFLALEQDLAGRGIIIDKSCKDITRLRLYSYDPAAYYNLQAETYTSLYIPPVKEHQYNNTTITVDGDKKLTDAIKDIQDNHINIAENYNEWRDLAIIFNNELGEEGRGLFHAVSSQSSKYDEGETDDFFDKIGSYGYQEKGIGSFYYMYDEAKKKMQS